MFLECYGGNISVPYNLYIKIYNVAIILLLIILIILLVIYHSDNRLINRDFQRATQCVKHFLKNVNKFLI